MPGPVCLESERNICGEQPDHSAIYLEFCYSFFMAEKKKKRSLRLKKSSNTQSDSLKSSAQAAKKRALHLSMRTRIILGAAAAALLIGFGIYSYQAHRVEKISLTYLDSISMQDLYQKPQSTFEETIEVHDSTVYGTSLVFYDQAYQPLETDGFYGRNAMLKNIEDGSTITTTFSGGADSGFDLQSIPEGVYEIYLYDGYTPKRAWTEKSFSSDPVVTVRDNGTVKKVQLSASEYYLDKFGVKTDRPYLYLAVTESEPVVRYADVMLDPAGLVPGAVDYVADGFDENEQSWALARRVQTYLENAGLKVAWSHQPTESTGYAGSGSRSALGYDQQAKVFVSFTMDSQDEPRPYCLSSPFSNGRLGNQIVLALRDQGVDLQPVTTLPQLDQGNGYDAILPDASLQNSPFSSSPAIRETGGKATSAGKMDGWQANEAYSNSPGMEAVLFCYASTENADSRTYYLEHQDQIARGIAQGILNYAHISASIDQPVSSESGSSQTLSNTQQEPAVSSQQSGADASAQSQPAQPGSAEDGQQTPAEPANP